MNWLAAPTDDPSVSVRDVSQRRRRDPEPQIQRHEPRRRESGQRQETRQYVDDSSSSSDYTPPGNSHNQALRHSSFDDDNEAHTRSEAFESSQQPLHNTMVVHQHNTPFVGLERQKQTLHSLDAALASIEQNLGRRERTTRSFQEQQQRHRRRSYSPSYEQQQQQRQQQSISYSRYKDDVKFSPTDLDRAAQTARELRQRRLAEQNQPPIPNIEVPQKNQQSMIPLEEFIRNNHAAPPRHHAGNPNFTDNDKVVKNNNNIEVHHYHHRVPDAARHNPNNPFNQFQDNDSLDKDSNKGGNDPRQRIERLPNKSNKPFRDTDSFDYESPSLKRKLREKVKALKLCTNGHKTDAKEIRKALTAEVAMHRELKKGVVDKPKQQIGLLRRQKLSSTNKTDDAMKIWGYDNSSNRRELPSIASDDEDDSENHLDKTTIDPALLLPKKHKKPSDIAVSNASTGAMNHAICEQFKKQAIAHDAQASSLELLHKTTMNPMTLLLREQARTIREVLHKVCSRSRFLSAIAEAKQQATAIRKNRTLVKEQRTMEAMVQSQLQQHIQSMTAQSRILMAQKPALGSEQSLALSLLKSQAKESRILLAQVEAVSNGGETREEKQQAHPSAFTNHKASLPVPHQNQAYFQAIHAQDKKLNILDQQLSEIEVLFPDKTSEKPPGRTVKVGGVYFESRDDVKEWLEDTVLTSSFSSSYSHKMLVSFVWTNFVDAHALLSLALHDLETQDDVLEFHSSAIKQGYGCSQEAMVAANFYSGNELPWFFGRTKKRHGAKAEDNYGILLQGLPTRDSWNVPVSPVRDTNKEERLPRGDRYWYHSELKSVADSMLSALRETTTSTNNPRNLLSRETKRVAMDCIRTSYDFLDSLGEWITKESLSNNEDSWIQLSRCIRAIFRDLHEIRRGENSTRILVPTHYRGNDEGEDEEEENDRVLARAADFCWGTFRATERMKEYLDAGFSKHPTVARMKSSLGRSSESSDYYMAKIKLLKDQLLGHRQQHQKQKHKQNHSEVMPIRHKQNHTNDDDYSEEDTFETDDTSEENSLLQNENSVDDVTEETEEEDQEEAFVWSRNCGHSYPSLLIEKHLESSTHCPVPGCTNDRMSFAELEDLDPSNERKRQLVLFARKKQVLLASKSCTEDRGDGDLENSRASRKDVDRASERESPIMSADQFLVTIGHSRDEKKKAFGQHKRVPIDMDPVATTPTVELAALRRLDAAKKQFEEVSNRARINNRLSSLARVKQSYYRSQNNLEDSDLYLI